MSPFFLYHLWRVSPTQTMWCSLHIRLKNQTCRSQKPCDVESTCKRDWRFKGNRSDLLLFFAGEAGSSTAYARRWRVHSETWATTRVSSLRWLSCTSKARHWSSDALNMYMDLRMFEYPHGTVCYVLYCSLLRHCVNGIYTFGCWKMLISSIVGLNFVRQQLFSRQKEVVQQRVW